MRRSMLAFAVAVLAVACTTFPPDAIAISGGQPDGASGVTVAVVFASTGGFVCSGAILDAQHVATTAGCLLGVAADYSVVAGSTTAAPVAGSQTVAVAGIRRHPGHTNTSEDDIAVLVLATPLTLGGSAIAATMPPQGSLPLAGAVAHVAGYGSPSLDMPSAVGSLLGLTTAIYAPTSCGGAYRAVIVCTRSTTGSTCASDGGSPLTIGATLIGITTGYDGTAPCQTGSTNFFVDVAAPEILQFLLGSDAPPVAPRVTTPGQITVASARVGETATCTPATLSAPVAAPMYAFFDATTGRNLQDSSKATYTLPSATLGMTIGCLMRAGNAGGSLSVIAGNTIGPVVAAIPRVRLTLELATHSTRVRQGGRVRSTYYVHSSRVSSQPLRICVTVGAKRVCVGLPTVVPGNRHLLSAPISLHGRLGRRQVLIVATSPDAITARKVFHFTVIRRKSRR